MKPKYILLPLIAIATFYLSACQKDFSTENDIVARVDSTSVGDSNYLDKIIFTNTTGNLTDTMSDIRYEYDALKRVITIIDAPTPSVGYLEKRTSNYFYNSIDTLPYKKIEIDIFYYQPLNNNIDTTTTYYYYSVDNKRIKDSAVKFSYRLNVNGSGTNYITFSKTINNYQYSSNKIYGNSITTILYSNNNTNTGNTRLVLDTATLDGNGNLVANNKWDNFYSPTLLSQATVTYDNKPSPFYKLSNFKTLNIFPYGETFFNEMQSKNNRLHIIEGTNGNGFNDNLTGKYEYNANGYPKRIVDATASGTVKIIFIYKVL
jgi:hypothetical protein